MIRVLLTAIGLLSMYCGQRMAGTETETHTGCVAGIIVNEDSTAAGNLPVTLRFLDGDSAVAFTTVTDAAGAFRMDSLAPGNYFAEAFAPPSAAAAAFEVRSADTARMSARMAATGAVTGKLCVPFLGRLIKVAAKIREIDRVIVVDSTGYFEMTGLPAFGGYTLQFQSLNVSGAAPLRIIDLVVTPGETVSVGNIALFTGNARVRAPRLAGDSLATRAEVRVTAADMLAIAAAAQLRASEVYAAVPDIPEGMDRVIEVTVYDAAGMAVESGADTVDIVADSTVETIIGLNHAQSGN